MSMWTTSSGSTPCSIWPRCANDPTGHLNPQATYDINHLAFVRPAQKAKQAGVPRARPSFASSSTPRQRPQWGGVGQPPGVCPPPPGPPRIHRHQRLQQPARLDDSLRGLRLGEETAAPRGGERISSPWVWWCGRIAAGSPLRNRPRIRARPQQSMSASVRAARPWKAKHRRWERLLGTAEPREVFAGCLMGLPSPAPGHAENNHPEGPGAAFYLLLARVARARPACQPDGKTPSAASGSSRGRESKLSAYRSATPPPQGRARARP